MIDIMKYILCYMKNDLIFGKKENKCEKFKRY